MTLKSDRPPFDEAAAEEELARIRDAIEATQRKRQQAVLDFEAFLRGVRASARAQPAGGSDSGEAAQPDSALRQRVIPSGPAAAPDANPAALTGPAAEQQPAFRTTPGIPAKGASLFGDEPPRAVVSPPQRSKRVGRSAAVVAGAVLLVSAVALVQLRVDPESTQADVPPAPPREAIKPVATTSAQGDPDRDGVAVPPPAGALQVEFVTIRAVWMRISVDGERVVERQVPAGQRLRFEAARQVVVRAGDAGGVRLSVGGGPERPLGRDGQVVNRTIAR
ncbi:MAG TPA: RodZ domain-containing protein [Vicinamibacterales bacterium]|nr:RodZ domain-containing protein [Vicinamibacterales bacterium]